MLDLTDSSNARKTITNKKTIKKRKEPDRDARDVSGDPRKAPSCLRSDISQVGQLLCCVRRKKRPEDRVETAFRRLDINGDGFIDLTEFQKVIKKIFLIHENTYNS